MKISRGRALLVTGILLVVIDQVIKILVKSNMTIGENFNVLGDWFKILFIENEGMAFGMKFGGMFGKFVLTAFRLVLFGFLCWWITSLNRKGRRIKVNAGKDNESVTYEHVPTGVLVGLTLITAGAFGNIIDCLFYGQLFSASTAYEVARFGGSYAPVMFGKVVDMFYFPIIRSGEKVIFFSPVFNFADSCVTVGAFYLLLFQWKFFSGEGKKKDKEK